VLTSINMVLHGWASYFKHAIAQRVFDTLDNFTWRRVIRILRERHRWCGSLARCL
jgi:RNA-directed DNA polymerase